MLEVLILILVIIVLVAWIASIGLLIDAARDKGYFKDGGAGVLWFIGIFATPIVVGLYVCALPDRSDHMGTPDIPTL